VFLLCDFDDQPGLTGSSRIVPVTAHAAFDKGAAYMGIKVHEVPVDPATRQVNLKRVRRAMFVLLFPILSFT
jgi:sphinganine-1-phosphate aldolase